MSNENSLVIHLLDKEYRVACPAGEQDNLLAAARYLDKQLREVRDANVIGLERIAIMTAPTKSFPCQVLTCPRYHCYTAPECFLARSPEGHVPEPIK